MVEKPNTPEQPQPNSADAPIEWQPTPQSEIESMSEPELRQYLANQDVKLQRLYQALMSAVESQKAGIEPRPQDTEHILHPERIQQ